MLVKQMNNSMKPIFRWAGSKRKLLQMIKSEMPCSYKRYVEPFCGSACLFFDLNTVNAAILSDINPDLINAYKQIRRTPKAIHERCAIIPRDKDQYYQIRSELNINKRVTERAVDFIYLNRNCFNGVYRTNRDGIFNVPFGSRTGSLPNLDRFISASKKLKCAEIFCSDYTKIVDMAKKDDFFYLDPPYSVRGKRSQGEYGPNSFNDDNIEKLVNSLMLLDKVGAKFILSYKLDPFVIEKVSSFSDVIYLEVDRHVAGFAKHRNKADEILVKNY